MQYSEGDPTIFEEENSGYFLSKTDNLEMTDKFSGEQNRQVYDQVRPSYMANVKPKPILDIKLQKITDSQGKDITMKKYAEEENIQKNKGKINKF